MAASRKSSFWAANFTHTTQRQGVKTWRAVRSHRDLCGSAVTWGEDRSAHSPLPTAELGSKYAQRDPRVQISREGRVATKAMGKIRYSRSHTRNPLPERCHMDRGSAWEVNLWSPASAGLLHPDQTSGDWGTGVRCGQRENLWPRPALWSALAALTHKHTSIYTNISILGLNSHAFWYRLRNRQ